MLKNTKLFLFDQEIRNQGFRTIAGIDEAGRGPWAGPVVAAAVIMPPDIHIPDVDDSKKLSPLKRESLYHHITSACSSWAVGVVNHTIIDEMNILNATFYAVSRAVQKLSFQPELCLIDGNMTVPGISTTQRCIIKGDGISFSIACASIIAKVTRDRIMEKLDSCFPGWHFAQHKGYGTPEHRNALERLGISPIHRKSFSPVKEMVSYVKIR